MLHDGILSQILVHRVVDHIVDTLVDKTVRSRRSVLINLLVDDRVNEVIRGAILLAVVIVIAVAAVVVGGTSLLDEYYNDAAGKFRYAPWKAIRNICHSLTLSLVQKPTAATAAGVSTLVATQVVRVSGGLIPIVIVASLAPEATGLAAIVVISTAESTTAAVLVSLKARVVATAVIALIGAVVILVTIARGPASAIVVV
jgi:hypothetical protein